MSLNPNQQAEKIKQALAEVRANKAHFTAESSSQIVMLLLDKLRRLQTLEPRERLTNDEIRLVTVMFIDVKDSTEMVQHLDTSDWKVVIATAHDLIADIVDQWDGQIGQYLGDGVLCFFGAQRSRGDDAPHAVSCALQIQSAINTYAQSLQELHGIDFGLRIGISTGRVIVGMIGRQTVKQELLALGPATNLAARLQGVAPVGGILVDSATYNRIRRDYITQAQTSVEFKGFDDPISNYLVLGRRTQPANQFTDTKVASIELPLLGRDDDLALISYLCDTALQNKQCQVMTITGDIGIGKSRLLQESVHLTEGHFTHIIMSSQYESRTQSQNLLWDMLMNQCNLTDDMPITMVQQQVEAYIKHMWEDDDAIKSAHAIAHLAGFDIAPPDDNPIHWVLNWFEGVARKSPIAIMVDNLQWADEQSIDLLEQIAQRLHQTASVIISAGRPEYATIHPRYMQGCDRKTTIDLETLHKDTTLSIINHVFSKIERIPITLANEINERVEGNPLFVREYLSMLFDTNVFKTTQDGNWRFNIIMLDVALNTLPNGLLSILQARLDDLPNQARQVMQAASISGQRFWESSVALLLDTDNVPSVLRYLLTRGMVISDENSMFEGERQYHFRHSLYREVAYEMIPRAKREAYHEKMFTWLLEHIAGNVEQYDLLAEQFSDAGENLAALQAYLEAVEVKISLKKEYQALKMIDKSLSISNKVDRASALPIVARLWSYRGEALIALERYEEASAASQSALMLLKELPDDQLSDSRITAERILGLSNTSLGRFNEAYDALTRAHNLLPQHDRSQIASVLIAFGRLYYYQSRLEESHAYQKRAVINAEKSQDLQLIAEALSQLGLIDFERGNLVDALTAYEESLQIHRSLQRIPEQANDLFYIGLVHLHMADYNKAFEYFSVADNLLNPINHTNILLQAYRGLVLILLERTTQGKALIADATSHILRDVDMQQRLQLVNLQSLAITKDYANLRDQALAFVQQDRINPSLKARALRHLGVASYNLGTSDALEHLNTALNNEIAFAGLDTWLCHAELAIALEDNEAKSHHFSKAQTLIIERANNLNDYAEMKNTFLENDFVKNNLNRDL